MTNNFAVKYIWACAVGFISRLAGEIFLFKIVKMNLSKSRQKKKKKKKIAKVVRSNKIHINSFVSKHISMKSN